MNASFEDIRIAGLRAAWSRARTGSPYWRETLPDLAPSAIDRAALSRIPVLTRDRLVEIGPALRTRTGLPDLFVFSNGTGGNRVSTAQTAFRTEPLPTDGVRPLLLQAEGPSRGSIPGHRGIVRVPMRDRGGYLHALQLLRAEHRFEGFEPRISGVMLNLTALKQLVQILWEEGVTPGSLPIRSIGTYGWHLTARWRTRILAMFPGATLDVGYGCSEAPSRAFRCRGCGSYHFPADTVWEVLDTEGRLVAEGPGRIVLTPLRENDTTLFRYAPGDMVEVTPRCALSGELGFRYLGRERQMHAVDGVWPVRPVMVQEVVDCAEWVGRATTPRYQGITHTDGTGFPKWRIEPDAGRLRVELELVYDPAVYADAWAARRAEVTAELRALSPHPELFDRVVDVVGLRPGSLDAREIDLC